MTNFFTCIFQQTQLEFAEYNEVEEAGVASIHGVMTHLSPVKKSRKGNNYFHGQVCDGVNSMRLVGFATLHQRALQDFLESQNAVEIRNCQIKKSNRDSEKMEIVMKGATKICPSSKEFDISAIEFANNEATEITLDKLKEIEPLTIINTNVHVVSCREAVTLGTRQRQELKVCDGTGWCLMQLWEENIGLFKED